MTQPVSDNSQLILNAVLRHVPFEGWTDRALMMAMDDVDLPKGSEAIYAPGGALGLIEIWSAQLDDDMVLEMDGRGLDNLRIRDKVLEAVWIRLNLIGPHAGAARRAVSRLALPDALGQASGQLWASADAIWTAIGDQSQDYNYYTKRTILSGVIGSSLMAWLADDTEDKANARAFLERRIGNVMQFEKAKGQTLAALSAVPKPKEIIDLLRQGPRRRRRRRAPSR